MADTRAFSTPVKAGAAGVGIGGLIAIGWQFRRDTQVLFILFLGVIGVILLLMLYSWFLSRREAAKSATMGEELKAGGRRKPREINQPQQLAMIADLQSKFDEGVEKFRSAGKNLYSLPWYLLIGEPGSGKTEAIRHCNVGFPPGLQEEQQGVGGTVNMNWWFTNYAVILDTAGRLIFDGIEAGTTAEWREFLKLLNRARPNCPINGLLLVIPADSLIVDTADQIEAKAGKIAQQLDVIQRTLGVRFPAFVVVTKSDRINGFREFFDSMDDPRLQHQIVGWSNPDPLDSPFNPELVEEHLAAVEQRLNRRRLGLLLDPVHTEDPQGRRLDQVDALYAFPESLTVVGPRLRRYLERIFTAGEWAPKPLFLRGIYFTSSMREGSALDKDLADLLGVPVQSLPEGRVWEQDRAFFLRDLFVNKVFREKGLVTRANNTRGVQSRRKMAVLGTGFAAVIGLSAMTIYGRHELDRSVGDQTQYWTDLHDSYAGNNLALLTVGSPVEYRGAQPVPFGAEHPQLRQVVAAAHGQVDAPVKVPPAFFWTKLTPLFQTAERTEAYRRVFEATVVEPLVDDVRMKLRDDPRLDGTDSVGAARTADALQALLQLEGARAAPADRPPLKLDPLFRYLLSDDQYAHQYGPDATLLQDTCDWLFPVSGQWPYKFIDVGTEASAAPIRTGVDRLTAYWNAQFGDDNAQRVTVQLCRSLRVIRDADRALIQRFTAATGDTGSALELAGRLDLWDRSLKRIDDERATADKLLAKINDPSQRWTDRTSLVALYRDDRVAAASTASAQRRAVRAACPPSVPTLADVARQLDETTASRAAIDAPPPPELDELDDDYFKPAGSPSAPRYQLIDTAYEAVKAQAEQLKAGPDLTGAPLDKVASAATLVPQAESAADAFLNGLNLPADAKDQQRVCAAVLRQLGVDRRVDQLVRDALTVNLKTELDVAALVRSAAPATVPVDPPPPPMTAPPADEADARCYQPAAALRLMAGWAALRQAVRGTPGASVGTFATQDDAVQQYAGAYVQHWAGVTSAAAVVPPFAWSDLAKQLPTADAAADAVARTSKGVTDALKPLDATASPQAAALVPPEMTKTVTDTLGSAAPTADGVPPADRKAMAALQAQWAGLAAKSAADARDELVSSGPKAVATNDVLLAPPAGPYQAYWEAVSQGALASLTREPGSAMADRQNALLATLNRFPLAAPSPGVPELGPADLARAVQQLNQMSKAAQVDPATEFAALPHAPAWFTEDYHLLEFGSAGAGAAPPGADDAQLQRARTIVALLTDPVNPQCRVSTVSLPAQTRAAAKAGLRLAPPGTLLTFSVETNNILNNLAVNLPAFPDTKADEVTRVDYFLQEPGAAFVQFGGDGHGQVQFDGPYPCLRALYAAGAQQPDPADGTKWLVPLRSGVAGPVVFVRFTFSRPIPAP
jgi:hypothetical protein